MIHFSGSSSPKIHRIHENGVYAQNEGVGAFKLAGIRTTGTWSTASNSIYLMFLSNAGCTSSTCGWRPNALFISYDTIGMVRFVTTSMTSYSSSLNYQAVRAAHYTT